MHDYTGLPWWSVIVLTTIMMRTAITLPLALYQQYIFAKVENLKYEMDEIVKEMKIETNYGIYKYNWPKEYARRLYNHSMKKQWNKLIVRENCHPAKASILVLVQIPLWISLSMSIRNLCYMLPKQDADAYTIYQQFTTDGFLWITNLTVADSFVLPIAMGLFNLAIIEIIHMNRVKELTKWKQYLTYFFRITAIGMIPIAMYVPSCLSLYWATSSAFGLIQNLVLLSPKLRRFARIPDGKSYTVLAYPEDCNKYVMCSDGRCKLENCEPTYVFDPVTSTCTHRRASVSCDFSRKFEN
ncbi:mitochondrial inner membrane protein cox18 [Lasius niger]|uniref:Mitochondrial inner membrane protein cox18 n=1 Tax=Lasius niger TaxID=67767 RepID=A0A0J7KVW0_LASNI|nr:mitochondrial inner membrane protein cox18 [Lasius niger]